MSDNQLESLKHGPASTGVHDLMLRRWSPRSFAAQPVPHDDLKKIFTAASWAASSYNEQPWRFLLGIKGDAAHGETHSKIFAALAEFNQQWANTAPVLIASLAKKTFSHNNAPNRVAMHDVGAASANMCLQAIDLGIHTHGMGGFSPDALRASFSIPDDFEPIAVWAMGYLGEPVALPESFRTQELAPRTRKSLSDFVLINWKKAAEI